MFGIGPWELVVILVVALLVLGPKRLPDVARSLGKGLAEFRRASSDLRTSLALEDSTKPPPAHGPAQAGGPDAAGLEPTAVGEGGDEAAPAATASEAAQARSAEGAADGADPTNTANPADAAARAAAAEPASPGGAAAAPGHEPSDRSGE